MSFSTKFINRRLTNRQRLALQRVRRRFLPNQFAILDHGADNTFDLPTRNKLIGDCHITIRQGEHNCIQLGHNSRFNQFSIAITGNHNRVIIGDDVKLSGKLIVHGDHLQIRIGARTTAIGVYVLARDRSVSIGQDCMLSRGIEIRATDTHRIYDLHTNEQLNPSTHDVIIGNRIWLAANVTVSKNVHLADGCIVGAGAFVNKSVTTPNCLIVGSPAKVIRQQVRWER